MDVDMLESELAERLRQLCVEINRLRPGHVLYYHTYDSRRSPSGFPDVVLIVGPPECRRVIWVELKSAHGRLSRAQRQWMDALHQAGQCAVVVRPRTWDLFRDWVIRNCRLEDA
ncbi:MAG: hypothetical protein KatS3mg051_2218 [Anaerolineae bacterium]|nr:MAG: hypothetical protein KatS3mg051_2218 [Anaerolineae bacterium]